MTGARSGACFLCGQQVPLDETVRVYGNPAAAEVRVSHEKLTDCITALRAALERARRDRDLLYGNATEESPVWFVRIKGYLDDRVFWTKEHADEYAADEGGTVEEHVFRRAAAVVKGE